MRIGRLFHKDLPRLLSSIRLFGSIRTVNSRGLRFKLIGDNWITQYRARTFSDKEPEMLDWLDEYLLNNDILFDIGANIGIYSIYAALRKSKVSVYAFEPEYSNLYQLKCNIINNNLQSIVTPYSIAFGDSTGISYLHIQDLTPGAALHTVSNAPLTKTKAGQDVLWKEGIAKYTIDDFCDMSGLVPNLIKIDVDGNETEILNGGKNTFSDTRLRSVFIEVDSRQTKCEAILGHYGFVLSKKIAENQIWIRQ